MKLYAKPIAKQLVIAALILTSVTILSLGIRHIRFSVHRANTIETPRDMEATASFSVEAPASMTTSKSVYKPGEVIVVDFSGAEENANDWIGLFPKGGDNNAYLAWVCTDNTHIGTPGIIDSTVTFWAPSTPGDYEVRLFFDGSRNVEAADQFDVSY